MTENINRHAYVDFSTKPYIYYHGIPYQKRLMYVPQYSNDMERTIIRSNQPNFTSCSPENTNTNTNTTNTITLDDNNWSNFVRKDNMYKRYAAS